MFERWCIVIVLARVLRQITIAEAGSGAQAV